MRCAAALALTLVLAVAAPAQSTKAAGQDSPTARALLNLEDDWARGVVRRDTAMFKRMLAPGFVYTEDAQMMSRADVLKGLVGDDHVTEATNHEMSVHDFGGGTAVVTGVLELKGRGKDGAFDRRFRFTDTWQRRHGRWRIIAAQDCLMPK
jgi:ketosteroid isomerase-like protein